MMLVVLRFDIGALGGLGLRVGGGSLSRRGGGLRRALLPKSRQRHGKHNGGSEDSSI